MKITLDALEVLDAIDRHGGFSAAARHLHRAQSAVSYAVRQLEEQLGLQLFDRDGWRATFTPAGRLVLEQGRRALGAARAVEAVAVSLYEGWEPRLALVVDAVLPLGPVFDAVARLDAEGAPTRVEVVGATLGGVPRRFDEIDADLMLAKELLPRDDLASEPLPEVEMVLVAAPTHPLAAGCEAVDREALQLHREILVYDSGAPMPAASGHAIGGSRRFLLGDFGSKREALRRGLGYGWLPMALCEDALAAGALVELPLTGGSRFRFVPVLAWRLGRPQGRAARRLRALLAQDGSAG